MKHRILKTLSLGLVATLTSCGSSDIKGAFYYGDEYTKMNAVVVEYNFSSPLKEGSKYSGKIKTQENTVLRDAYILAYSNNNPFKPKDSYVENVLLTVSKTNLESAKDGVSFELTLDLEKAFPNKDEGGEIYFVIHSSDFETGNLSTFGYSTFKYSWDGSSVKLS